MIQKNQSHIAAPYHLLIIILRHLGHEFDVGRMLLIYIFLQDVLICAGACDHKTNIRHRLASLQTLCNVVDILRSAKITSI